MRNGQIVFLKLSFVLPLFIFFLVIPALSLAADLVLLDETFVRGKGKPKTEQRTFSAVAGEGFLLIQNVGNNGKNRVSSATIMLNGKQIVGPKEFNQKIGLIEKPIMLKQNNILKVQLKSAPGSFINIQILGRVVDIIGVEGGILEGLLPNGTRIIVEIPPDALLEDTQISISGKGVTGVPNPGGANIVVGNIAIDLGPDGLQFNLPVFLTIQYIQEEINSLADAFDLSPEVIEENFGVFFFDPDEGVYKPLPVIKRDISNNEITVALEHFTILQRILTALIINSLEINDPLRADISSRLTIRYFTPLPGLQDIFSIHIGPFNFEFQLPNIDLIENTKEFTVQLPIGYETIRINYALVRSYDQIILVDKTNLSDFGFLLERHAPILKFTQNENFFSSSVESDFEQGLVFLNRPFPSEDEPIDLNSLGAKASKDFYLDLPNGINTLPDLPKVVYGTATECISNPDRIALQYWFHYFRDDKEAPFGIAQHEGDWEMITVLLDKNTEEPIEVAFSQHFEGERALWEFVEKEDMHHPVIYVAEGSHANYPMAGNFEVCFDIFRVIFGVIRVCVEPGEVGSDQALGDGITLSPHGDVVYGLKPLPRLTDISSFTQNSWLLFSGKWGSRELKDGSPPVTPSFNGLNDDPLKNNPKWLDPCAWVSKLPKLGSLIPIGPFFGTPTFSILPSEDPTFFDFPLEATVIGFDTDPSTGLTIPNGTLVTDQFSSFGLIISGAQVLSDPDVFGRAASPPNTTVGIGNPPQQCQPPQIFTFDPPAVAVGIINTSPDGQKLSFFSGPNGTGTLLGVLLFTDNDLVDEFRGAECTSGEPCIGSVVTDCFANELDELTFTPVLD